MKKMNQKHPWVRETKIRNRRLIWEIKMNLAQQGEWEKNLIPQNEWKKNTVIILRLSIFIIQIYWKKGWKKLIGSDEFIYFISNMLYSDQHFYGNAWRNKSISSILIIQSDKLS